MPKASPRQGVLVKAIGPLPCGMGVKCTNLAWRRSMHSRSRSRPRVLIQKLRQHQDRYTFKPEIRKFAAKGSIHSSEPDRFVETSAPDGPGGSGRNGGNFGGGDRPDDDDSDDGDYAGAWVVLFLAGIPYAIDGARRLSFGKDGIRILNLPAEPGMHKPIFAAAAMGRAKVVTPAPPPQTMSNEGGVGIVAVLALLLVCGGGYYIYYHRRQKRGTSSSPQEEYDDLQMMDSIRVANRDIDPAFFHNAQPREDQDADGTAPRDSMVSDLVDKDSMFGNAPSEHNPLAFPPSPLGQQRPSNALAPAAESSKTELSPDQVTNDHSSELKPSFADEASRACDVIGDVPIKDQLFGRRPEPVEQQSSLAKVQLETEGTLKEANRMQDDAENKDALFGVPPSEVKMASIGPQMHTPATVPQAPSPSVDTSSVPQLSPDGVVKVHDTTPLPQTLSHDTQQGDILRKDLEAKDDFFSKQSTPSQGAGGESIMNAVADPIMNDIAKELEDDRQGGDNAVGVGLKVDGGRVSVEIDYSQGEPTATGKSNLPPEVDSLSKKLLVEGDSKAPTKEDSKTSGLVEEDSAPVKLAEKSTSEPAVEEKPLVPAVEEKASKSAEEESAPVVSAEEKASEPTEDEKPSVPAVEEKPSEPAEEESVPVASAEEKTSEPTEDEKPLVPALDKKASEPAEEESAPVASAEEKVSEPAKEEEPLVPAVEEKASEPAEEESAPVASAEEKVSEPAEEEEPLVPVAEEKASEPVEEESAPVASTEEKVSEPAKEEEPLVPVADEKASESAEEESAQVASAEEKVSEPAKEEEPLVPVADEKASEPVEEESAPVASAEGKVSEPAKEEEPLVPVAEEKALEQPEEKKTPDQIDEPLHSVMTNGSSSPNSSADIEAQGSDSSPKQQKNVKNSSGRKSRGRRKRKSKK